MAPLCNLILHLLSDRTDLHLKVLSGSDKEARDERLTKSGRKDRWRRSMVDLALGFRFQTHNGSGEGPEMTKLSKKYQ